MIAVCTPVTVVPRSLATVAIDTFITDVSRVMRNWPVAEREENETGAGRPRRAAATRPAAPEVVCSAIRPPLFAPPTRDARYQPGEALARHRRARASPLRPGQSTSIGVSSSFRRSQFVTNGNGYRTTNTATAMPTRL